MEGTSALSWRTASYSGSNGGQCVEVATAGLVLVRDTVRRDGGTLAFGPDAWASFTEKLKHESAV
jgi:hypothetical protein